MYTRFFGFAQKPFNVTPDPRFLFLTQSHEEALASMIYGIQERKGFISITGKVGTGKTTLIQELIRKLDKKVKIVLIFQTRVTFEELLKQILRELELPPGDIDKGSMVDRLNDYLIQCLAHGENLALIIDEAQHLGMEVLEELRLLSNLETSTSKLLQIVLVGQPELKEKLASEALSQLQQRIVLRRQIQPLSEEDSKKYIEHRLNIVGSTTTKVFTPEAESLIGSYARGIPRNINVICDNALLIGYGLGRKKIDGSIVREVLLDLDMPGGESEPAALAKASPPAILAGSNSTSPRKVERRTRRAERGSGRRRKIFLFASGVMIVLLILLGKDYWEMNRVPKSVGQAASESKTGAPPTVTPGPGAGEKDEPNVSQVTFPMKAISESQTVSLPSTSQDTPQKKVKDVVIVARGETIFSLCKKYYNHVNLSLADHILAFNPEISNPHFIRVRQKITIPEITEESLLIPTPGGGFQIRLGTYYGRPEATLPYRMEPVLKGKEIEVLPQEMGARETWYQARAGKFASREEGLAAIQALRKTGKLPIFAGTPAKEETDFRKG